SGRVVCSQPSVPRTSSEVAEIPQNQGRMQTPKRALGRLIRQWNRPKQRALSARSTQQEGRRSRAEILFEQSGQSQTKFALVLPFPALRRPSLALWWRYDRPGCWPGTGVPGGTLTAVSSPSIFSSKYSPARYSVRV